MADLPTRSDLFAVGRRSIVTTPNKRINPAVIDVPGSDINLQIGAASLMGEEIVAKLSKCLRGLFVETARDEQLDRVAFDRYGLTRFPATPATVDLVLSRPTPGIATPGTYPQGGRVRSPDGTVFATDSDAVFGNFTTSVGVTATALTAGVDSNIGPGLLVQFADAPFDPTITVTNPAGAAGGTEAESDIQFRGRIRDFFPTVRRGTLGAIEFGARQVPGVAVARAIEIENFSVAGLPLPSCEVQLIVGDANGGSTTPMLQAVRDKLIEYRAAGIPVEVLGGVVQYESVIWNLAFAANVDSVRVAEEVRAVTVAVGQFLRPGDTLHQSSLLAAARTVPGAIVFDDVARGSSLVSPVGDLIPASTNIILRIRPQDVSFV